MIGPIIYDFKRSLLRVSTILALIVFVLGGIGISYLTYTAFVGQYPSANIYGVIVGNQTSCIVSGVVYDAYGNTLSNAHISFIDKSGAVLAERSVSGVFTTSIDTRVCRAAGPVRVHVKASTGEGDTGVSWIHSKNYTVGYIGMGEAVPLTKEGKEEAVKEAPRLVMTGKLILISKKSGEAVLLVSGVDPLDPMKKPHAELYYALYTPRHGGGGGGGFVVIETMSYDEAVNLSYSRLGVLDGYVAMYRLKLDMNKTYLVIKYVEGNNTGYMAINYALHMPVDAIYTGVMASSTGFSLFIEFFPIIFLYLANVLMAKPRGSGALEFILARPVTRWDLYMTRFVAGALLALVAPALMLAAISAANQVLIGRGLDPTDILYLYLGTAGALIAFYSLVYMFAATVKPSHYLAIAIGMFLLFSIFWELVVIIVAMFRGGFAVYQETSYLLAYANPLGAATIAQYYMQLNHGLIQEIDVVNPYWAVISTLLWIILPFIIGYSIFKKK